MPLLAGQSYLFLSSHVCACWHSGTPHRETRGSPQAAAGPAAAASWHFSLRARARARTAFLPSVVVGNWLYFLSHTLAGSSALFPPRWRPSCFGPPVADFWRSVRKPAALVLRQQASSTVCSGLLALYKPFCSGSRLLSLCVAVFWRCVTSLG